MKQKLLPLLLALSLLLTGCGSTTSAPTAAVETTAPLEILTVFSPNENADGFVKTDIAVPAITDAVIIQQLVNVGVLAEDTSVSTVMEVSTDTGKATLEADFNDALRQSLLPMGTAGEYVLMGSVVNTFLTAYQADAITITVEGEVLETGHSVYDQPLTFYPENP